MGQHGMTFLPAPTYVLARAAWIPMLVIWHADGRFTRLAVHPAWPRDEHRLHQRRQPIGGRQDSLQGLQGRQRHSRGHEANEPG